MAMFQVNDKDIKELENDLKTFARKALPFATKNTLNSAAFGAQKLARRDVQVKMIQRNRFTIKSIQVDQARTLNINRQSASVGSTAPYMEDQEFGAIKTKKGAEGVPLATSYAAGQGQSVQPRTRLPRKPNAMSAIQLQKRRGKGSRKRRNLIAIQQAAKSGFKYIFLDLGRRKGIFKVTGGKRRPRIKMVWDMTRDSIVIPKTPWLKPAFDTEIFQLPKLYKKALTFQLRRHGLFK